MSATTERNWKQQFPSWPDDITALVTELEALGFTDESWGNDASPRCDKIVNGTRITVWIESADQSIREFEESTRFHVCATSATDAQEDIMCGCSTDEWSSVLKIIDAITTLATESK